MEELELHDRFEYNYPEFPPIVFDLTKTSITPGCLIFRAVSLYVGNPRSSQQEHFSLQPTEAVLRPSISYYINTRSRLGIRHHCGLIFRSGRPESEKRWPSNALQRVIVLS